MSKTDPHERRKDCDRGRDCNNYRAHDTPASTFEWKLTLGGIINTVIFLVGILGGAMVYYGDFRETMLTNRLAIEKVIETQKKMADIQGQVVTALSRLEVTSAVSVERLRMLEERERSRQ